MVQSAKTCVTKCPDDDDALSFVHAASAAAVADTAPLDPALAVTPSGSPHCKNAGVPVRSSPRTPHNSLADGTSAPKNLDHNMLGAGPRALPARQLTPPRLVRAAAVDNAAVGRGGAPVLAVSLATADWPGNAATAAPPACMPHCNNGSADAAAQTTLRILSKDNAAVGPGKDLVLAQKRLDTEVGPREIALPGSSLEVELASPLRGAFMPRSGYIPQHNRPPNRGPEVPSNHHHRRATRAATQPRSPHGGPRHL
jgi:hypothetical protein